jgi:uncharacterized Ntn-hydrolase superfamily protein
VTADAGVSWRERLAFRVATHDVIVSGDRLLGRVAAEAETARLAVVEVIDEALAAGVPRPRDRRGIGGPARREVAAQREDFPTARGV